MGGKKSMAAQTASQGERRVPPVNHPSLVIAFPGREAYDKGMDDSFCRNFAASREAMEQACDYMQKDLAALCYKGEKAEERWKSVCLAAHCYAAYRAVAPRLNQPHVFTGYSQGEFTACAAAGVFSFPEVLGLIFQLETILLEGKRSDEGMVRIIGLERSRLRSCCRQADPQGKEVFISAIYSADQTMLSGRYPQLAEAARLAKRQGAQWALPIATERAFHSPLCAGAGDTAQPLFEAFPARDAGTVYSCYDGQPSCRGSMIRHKLSMQLDHPLQWGALVRRLQQNGVRRLLEIGPGCTVSGNTRVAAPALECRWINTAKDVETI